MDGQPQVIIRELSPQGLHTSCVLRRSNDDHAALVKRHHLLRNFLDFLLGIHNRFWKNSDSVGRYTQAHQNIVVVRFFAGIRNAHSA